MSHLARKDVPEEMMIRIQGIKKRKLSELL